MKRRNIIHRIRQRFFYEEPRWVALINLINENKFKNYTEIGVWEGENVQNIIHACPTLEKINLIDPYSADEDYKGGSIYKKGQHDIVKKARELMISRTTFKKVKHIFKTSQDALENFDSNNLDIVFIDRLHYFDAVFFDIINWHTKVKKSGIVSGHDYNNKFQGVVQSVDTLYQNKKINLEDDAVWWIKK